MKKLVAVAPRIAKLVETNNPTIKENEVLIKIKYCAPKHGTEVADFRGTTPFMHEYFDEESRVFKTRDSGVGIVFGEFNLGNQIIGEIIEKGCNVSQYELGDIVCSYGNISEYIVINAIDNYKLYKMKDYSLWKNALCYDPAQFAFAGVRDACIRVGDFVCVIGLGAIGQIAIQLAKKAGSKVIGVDLIEKRRNIALKNGADYVYDPTTLDLGLELKKISIIGVDAIIETSGSQHALQSSLKGLAYGGIISYVAFAKEFDSGFNLGREAHFNNAKIVFSRASSEPNPDYPRWDRKRIELTCWDLLMNGYLNCEDLIDPIVDFENCDESYMKYVDQNPDLSIKMGIEVKNV